MSTLTISLPWILAFIATFAFASFVSGVAYWLARRPSEAMRAVARITSALALCVFLGVLVFVVARASHFFGSLLLFVVILVGTSALQALIERALQGETVAIKPHFVRSFFTYLCSASLLFIVAGALALTQWDVLVRSIGPFILIPAWVEHLAGGPYRWMTGAPGIPVWAECLSTALYGLLAGWLFAPLSLSFYRLLFQNIKLRPGIERPLRAGELPH